MHGCREWFLGSGFSFSHIQFQEKFQLDPAHLEAFDLFVVQMTVISKNTTT